MKNEKSNFLMWGYLNRKLQSKSLQIHHLKVIEGENSRKNCVTQFSNDPQTKILQDFHLISTHLLKSPSNYVYPPETTHKEKAHNRNQ